MHQNSAGDITAYPNTAINIYYRILWQFIQSDAKFIYGDILCVHDAASDKFTGRANIENKIVLLKLGEMFDFNRAVENILCGKTCDIHRVFSAAVRRSVSKFQLLQVKNGHPGTNRHSKNIDPFINTIGTDYLSTKNFTFRFAE